MKLKRRRPEDRFILAAQRAKAKEEGSLRRTTALMRKTEADTSLKSQKLQEREALTVARQARKARLLSERELRTAQLQPYVAGAKSVGKGVVSVGKELWRGLQYLGGEGPYKRPVTKKRSDINKIDIGEIDLGKIDFGPPI